MMVGYSENHDGNVYCMWNPVTEHLHVIRDIIWLKQMMFQKRVEENEAQMLPEVKAALVEQIDQEEVITEEEPEAAAANELYTLDPEEKDAETFPQVEKANWWVIATTRYGRSSRLPSRYREEMNAAAITRLASKNYYVMLKKKKTSLCCSRTWIWIREYIGASQYELQGSDEDG